MIQIKLEKAANGVIKKAHDSNFNGDGREEEEIVVYDFQKDDQQKFENTIKFIKDIFADLQIDTKGKEKNIELDISVKTKGKKNNK